MKRNAIRDYVFLCILLFLPLSLGAVIDISFLSYLSFVVLILVAFRENPRFPVFAAVPALIILTTSVAFGVMHRDPKETAFWSVFQFMLPQLVCFLIILVNEIRVKKIVSAKSFYLFVAANFVVLFGFAFLKYRFGIVHWIENFSFLQNNVFAMVLFATMLSKKLVAK